MKLIHGNGFDCIIMDNFMPGMDAKTFIAKAREEYPLCKFILMTATTSVAQEAARLGVNKWIGKPFELDDFLEAVKSCCANSRQNV